MNGRNKPWLILELKKAFTDTLTRKKYQGAVKDAVTDNMINRAFDTFDILLLRNELTEIAANYFSILARVKNPTNSEGEPTPFEDSDLIKESTTLFVNIINIAILELFESTKKVRPELIQILAWKNLPSSVNTHIKLICAFVGATFGHICATYPEATAEHKDARACFEGFLHGNFKTILIDNLLKREFISKEEAEAALAEIKDNEFEHFFKSPAGKVTIAAGAIAALTALVGIGYGIYAAVTQSSGRNNNEKPAHQPSGPQ